MKIVEYFDPNVIFREELIERDAGEIQYEFD